jgi:hypothetical protein
MAPWLKIIFISCHWIILSQKDKDVHITQKSETSKATIIQHAPEIIRFFLVNPENITDL